MANVLLVAGSANFSTRDVWDGYRLGLEARGLRVVPYPTFSFLQVLSADSVCSDIIGTALDVSNTIDTVVFVDGLYFRGRRQRVPQSIRRAGLLTVLIATDDPYDAIPNVESLYTYRFTNEIRCESPSVQYLPTATLPLPATPRIESPAYDISFLGTVFEDRRETLLEIARVCEREQRRFLIAGKILGDTAPFNELVFTEVRQRTIDTLEKWEIYARSRLTINLFRQTDKPADSPSPRIFEVTAFGQAALLTGPRRSEVTRIYDDAVYHFDDTDSALATIDEALRDDAGRLERVDRAREITLREHLYEHRAATLVSTLRAAEQQRSAAGASEDKVAWIIGCGRTGSTWLAELLGDLPGIRRWHEPYFGRLFRHIHERPEDLQRQASFFCAKHQATWLAGVRDLFFQMVQDRYPQFGNHSLVIKEVNTPELYPWLRCLFPSGRLILLIRDPFDVLDSYLDLQKPGSWNTRFGDSQAPLSEVNVRRTASHIESSLSLALDAYDTFPVEQRLLISYEDLLRDPLGPLAACGELISVPVDPQIAGQAVEKRKFEKHAKTGPLQFRRSGKAGGWKTSPNFEPEVLHVAKTVLGPLRARLGYTADKAKQTGSTALDDA